MAFKPDIDDLRESPAVHIVSTLHDQGYAVAAVEPNIDSHEQFALTELGAVFKQADVIAVLVRHRQFLDPEIRKKLRELGALDFCGLGNEG